MPSIEEQIKEIEEEIHKTQYNKATQHHIGKLKAKIARLKEQAEKRKGGSTGKSYDIKRSGNASISLVGFPSVGKSTILNRLTGADSEVGAYSFTTLDVVPGMMNYRGAEIQILDLPGLIEGAASGKGRGREVLSAVRSSDLILLVLDVFNTNIDVILRELHKANIRVDKKPPRVSINKTDRGGIIINKMVPQSNVDDTMIKDVSREFGIINAEYTLWEDLEDIDRFIDAITSNRTYIPSALVINKIDLVDEIQLDKIRSNFNHLNPVYISAEKNIDIENLKEYVFKRLDFIRIYLKPQGMEADMEEPLVMKAGTTVREVCHHLHRDFVDRFRYAMVWGKSAKFGGQRVGLQHVLMDEDVVTIIVRR